MAISAFDLFRIGIGPSSSHTVGPMRAALRFVSALDEAGELDEVRRVRTELFGSLGATGRAHGTDRAVLLGLEGESPETVDPATTEDRVAAIVRESRLRLGGEREVAFDESEDLIFHSRSRLPYHPNGIRFTALGAGDEEIRVGVYYSIGGGFVVDELSAGEDRLDENETEVPCPFRSATELLALCQTRGLRVSDVVMENEKAQRSEEDVRRGLLAIWDVMRDCVERGCRATGVLPGRLHLRRRAHELFEKLNQRPGPSLSDPLVAMDWVNLYALAVSEENAAGGRIVTAPTNGAGGIIPAVLHYYYNFCPGSDEEGVIRFLLTAAAIGSIYKENASISGAEVGCQGEVGSACSMAAGALAEVLGGTPRQVENAAEIGMEHNLGLTCDPVAGLVQVPCIERNAMAAVEAINAARMALRGDGVHLVSLDKVIKTMRDTGADMKVKYKETSRGGLAVNVTEC